MEDKRDQWTLSRRRFFKSGLAAGGVVAAGGILAACGGSNSGDSGSSSAAGSTAAAGTGASTEELKGTGEVIIGGFEERRARAVQERDPAALHQDVGIKTQFLLEPYDSFFSKAFQDGTSKSGQFDIYIMDDPWIPQYAAGGVLEPLSSTA